MSIIIKAKGNQVSKHKRSYENHTYTLDILHFKETLLKKPGAISSSLCLKQSNELLKLVYEKFFKSKPKEFILMLDLLEKHSILQIRKAIEALYKSGAKVRFDSIKMLLENVPEEQSSECINEIELACEAQLSKYALPNSVSEDYNREVMLI